MPTTAPSTVNTVAGVRHRGVAAIVVDDLRDAEIQHLRFDVVAGQQDVLGLQVAMKNTLAMGRLDRAADARQDSCGARGLEPSLADEHAAKILALDQFHHEVGAAVGQRAVIEDRDNGGVLQASDDLRLAPEPPARVPCPQATPPARL